MTKTLFYAFGGTAFFMWAYACLGVPVGLPAWRYVLGGALLYAAFWAWRKMA